MAQYNVKVKAGRGTLSITTLNGRVRLTHEPQLVDLAPDQVQRLKLLSAVILDPLDADLAAAQASVPAPKSPKMAVQAPPPPNQELPKNQPLGGVAQGPANTHEYTGPISGQGVAPVGDADDQADAAASFEQKPTDTAAKMKESLAAGQEATVDVVQTPKAGKKLDPKVALRKKRG